MGAIFIPSNRIFSIENDKILDNAINKVEIEVGTPTVKAQDDYTIENKVISQDDITTTSRFLNSSGNEVTSNYTVEYQNLAGSTTNVADKLTPVMSGIQILYVRSYCAMSSIAFIPIKMHIYFNNSERSVAYPLNTEKLDIDYSLSCKTTTYDAKVRPGDYLTSVTTTPLSFSTSGSGVDDYAIQQTEVSHSYTGQKYDISSNTTTTVTATLPIAGRIGLIVGNTTTYYQSYKNPMIGAGSASGGDKVFTLEFYIPYYQNLITAGYDDTKDSMLAGYVMDGTYTLYFPQTLTITVKGKAYTLDIPTETQKYGSGDDIYSISNNELIQSNAFFVDTNSDDNDITPQIEKLCNNILSEYEYGKEKAVVKCAVLDYYDIDGNKVIDPHSSDSSVQRLFKIGDEVIPLVFKSGSIDIEPLSKYPDDTMKVFKVVGQKVEYNGAPFQTLTLQEIKQESN